MTSATGNAPLAGIEVCASSLGASPATESPTRGCALTDTGGDYTIAQLRPGAYQVRFSQAYAHDGNYISQYYQAAATPSKATEVTVADGLTTTGIDAQLLTGGQIAGTVTSASTHTPLEGVYICASTTSGGVESGPCAFTDATGEYALTGLPTGSYVLTLGTDWESPSSNYLGGYLDGKSATGEATPVAVTAGSVTDETNAELQAGGQIAGTVTAAATGSGVGDILVCAENSDERCAHTDAAGDYTIQGVAGSSAHVKFTRYPEAPNYLSQLYSNQLTIGAAALVPVMPGGLTAGINAQLLTGGQITGRVTSAAGPGLSGVMVCAEHVGSFGEAFSNQTDGGETECAISAGPGDSASATSNALAVPAATNTRLDLLKAQFDARTGKLDFFLKLPASGHLGWRLFFDNADIGFVRTSRSSAGAAGRRPHSPCPPRGDIRHNGGCVPALVALASGSRLAHVGAVEIVVRPDAVARRALRAGRLLHVSGSLTFHSSLGGPPATHAVRLLAHEHALDRATRKRRES